MAKPVDRAIAEALGRPVQHIGPLSGGCVGEVYRVVLSDGEEVVAKVDFGPDPRLGIEGYMLDYLAARSRLPVPKVLHNSPSLLVMEFLSGVSGFDAQAEEHAAELLADLHSITSYRFGFERDTLIGGLHQPNPWTEKWAPFFAEHRLIAMGKQAVDARRMNTNTLARIEKLCGKLDSLIEEPDRPSLIHGDVWSANVLAERGRITGFIDPAIYFAHPEIELAFITLFNTFGNAFFRRYNELRPIRPGFFELRRDLYNLYPLLVHLRLFGGGYLSNVESTLKRHGC
ncbi:MAG: fructosamine kinase family protein [Candidatus Hydrogenedentota bacterium]